MHEDAAQEEGVQRARIAGGPGPPGRCARARRGYVFGAKQHGGHAPAAAAPRTPAAA